MSQFLIRMPETMLRTGYARAWIYKLIARRFSSLSQSKSALARLLLLKARVDEWIAERDKKAG